MITKFFGNKKHMVESLMEKESMSNSKKNSHQLVKLLICYWKTKKEKKNVFFSSKNHKCIYFRLHSKIIKNAYLFLIK